MITFTIDDATSEVVSAQRSDYIAYSLVLRVIQDCPLRLGTKHLGVLDQGQITNLCSAFSISQEALLASVAKWAPVFAQRDH